MTYSPGSPGYPPAQQPTTQFAAPTQHFGKAEGSSKLPVYLTAAVAVLGLAVYLSSFGPYFTGTIGAELFTPVPLYLGIVAAVLAGLLAGASLVPKQAAANAVVAVLSVLGFLLVLGIVITAPNGVSLDWGLYAIIAFTALEAIVAVAALLFDAGVIAPPAPRPEYEQQQYGQYGGPGGYYGQHAQHHGGPPQQQRPGYPTQYGGPRGGPSTGGFSAVGPSSGTPTPPTGFPSYRQPQQPSSSSAPTTQVPAQPQPSKSSTPKSGQTPS